VRWHAWCDFEMRRSVDTGGRPLQLFANKQTYHDNWWDRWMIKYFNTAMARELGERKHCHCADPKARFAVLLW
jgi:hypothetical protein